MWPQSLPEQHLISFFVGVLFLGGLQKTALPIQQSSLRSIPCPARAFWRRSPDSPMKGIPLSPSVLPGPSPTTRMPFLPFPSIGILGVLHSRCRPHASHGSDDRFEAVLLPCRAWAGRSETFTSPPVKNPFIALKPFEPDLG